MGLSGLGDLMLTCSTPQSRNYSYGLALGRGEDLAGRPFAEGVATAAIAAELAARNNIEAPIIAAVAADTRPPHHHRRGHGGACAPLKMKTKSTREEIRTDTAIPERR